MAKEAFNFIRKWKHLGEKEFTEIFLKELPKFGLGPLDPYRENVHFEPPQKVDDVAVKLQLGLPTTAYQSKTQGLGIVCLKLFPSPCMVLKTIIKKLG